MADNSLEKNVAIEKDEAISRLKDALAEKDAHILELEHTINVITSTRGWRFIERLRKVKEKIVPARTLRNRIFHLALRSLNYIRKEGFYEFIKNAGRRYGVAVSFFADENYRLWVEQNEPGNEDLLVQRKLARKFSERPKISIVTPVFNPDRKVFTAMLNSVLTQTYENWELCMADASSKPYVKEIIEEFRNGDRGRIKVKYLEKNLGITGNSNEALSLATGDYVALLDHDDTLAPFALFEVAKLVNGQRDADIIYSDRDIISYDDQRMYPFFKPDWSPDYLLSQNYLCHLIVFKKELLDKIHGFREGYDGSQDYDLFLRATEAASNIVHIPKILYHWRIVHGSASVDPTAKPYAYDAAIRALQDAFTRRGLKGLVTHGETKGFYDLKFVVGGQPKVLIIVLSKNGKDTLKTGLDSILPQTTYGNYEILVVDCGDQKEGITEYKNAIVGHPVVKIIKFCDKQHNISEVINIAVSGTDANYIALMPQAVKVLSGDWLERMLGFAQRKEIGAVGAKLLSRDGKIFSAGLILDRKGNVRRSHHGFPGDSPGYNGRIRSVHNVSAISTCIMMRKEVFAEVEGLDPQFNFYFDVDLCLKLRARNYRVVYEPHAELVVHEFTEDSPEMKEILDKEKRLLLQKWGDILKEGDPYYNPNLTEVNEDFSIRIKRERKLF